MLCILAPARVVKPELVDQIVDRERQRDARNEQRGHQKRRDQSAPAEAHPRDHVGRHADMRQTDEDGDRRAEQAVEEIASDLQLGQHGHIAVQTDLFRQRHARLHQRVCLERGQKCPDQRH